MTSPDAIVVGAGPVGSVTALMLARRGARVLILEARSSRARRRLGGEWLHPTAVELLQRVGITIDSGAHGRSQSDGGARGDAGRGFVVFPDAHTEPVVLPYGDHLRGFACDHHDIVEFLRSAALACPGVELRQARVSAIDGQRVTFRPEDGPAAPEAATADLIVGADGRSSVTRRALGLADNRRTVSYMAGVILENVALPYPGYGHVVLGGPGPILLFRIGPNRVRVTVDVPLPRITELKDPARLCEVYAPCLPAPLREPFREALRRRELLWAANQYRPRTDYGREGLALVGDAVGFFHPLTAAGMTLGFTDGRVLAESGSVRDYSRIRTTQCHVPDMLASSLYDVFTGTGAGAAALKAAVFRMWRENDRDRTRTMQLLSCQETRLSRFCNTFFRATSLATRDLVSDVCSRHWQTTPAAMYRLTSSAYWLARTTGPMVARWLRRSRVDDARPASTAARTL